jgi:hypothetical protein
MRAFDARLRRQRREDERPVPVWIEYNSLVVTQDDAIEAALRSGHVPLNAVLVVLPLPIEDRETWQRVCQAEHAAREEQGRRAEEQQQREPAGTDPADSTP